MRSGKSPFFLAFPLSEERKEKERGEDSNGGEAKRRKGRRESPLSREKSFSFFRLFSPRSSSRFSRKKSRRKGAFPLSLLSRSLPGRVPAEASRNSLLVGKGLFEGGGSNEGKGFTPPRSAFLPCEGKKRGGEKKVGKGKRRFSLFLLVLLLPSLGFSLFSLSLKKREKKGGTRFLAF